MAAEHYCLSCRHALNGPVLDLGELPPCNRYVKTGRVTDTHKMAVTDCPACGLVQLLDPPPAEFIVPRVPWIRYNEPEAHLDDVAKALLGLFRTPPHSALGVGPFDAPLLNRLNMHGLAITSLDLLAGLPALYDFPAFPYLETIQAQLRPATFSQAQTKQADIVSCRFLLEHSHDPVASLTGLKKLMSSDGLLLIEIPDSSKFIAALDYSFLWEEHVCYFVEPTIKAMTIQAGLEVAMTFRNEARLEDTLVVVLRPANANKPAVTRPVVDASSFNAYRSSFPSQREAYRNRLQDIAAKGKVAMIGMGHQSVMFVNAFGLQPFITFLVDDDANKVGCFTPGNSSQRIVPSSILQGRTDIAACLLAVSPRVESKVRENLRSMSQQGTEIYSIYAGVQGKNLIGN